MRNIDHIITRYLMGDKSIETKQKLKSWLDEDKRNKSVLNYLEKYWHRNESKFEPIDLDDKFDKIWTKAHEEQSPRTVKKSRDTQFYMKIAAIFLCLFVFGGILFLFQPGDPSSQHSSTIIKKAPKGTKLSFMLPDGTKVKLNSESSITYKDNFKDSIRFISLKGEAYFEVAHNANLPFRVAAGDFITEALGTEFKVRNYPEEHHIKIALRQGKVKVSNTQVNKPSSDVFLSPGQYASINEADDIMTGQYDPVYEFGWIDGTLTFQNASFNTIIHELERWYGVKIIYNTLPKADWNFDGQFTNVSLEYILNVISHSENFEFRMEKEIIYIKNKQ